MLDKFEARFPRYGSDNFVYAVAHYLDPHARGILLDYEFKTLDHVKSELVNMYEHNGGVNNDVIPIGQEDTQNNSDQLNVIERLLQIRKQRNSLQSTSRTESALEIEFRIFESKPAVESSVDILHWWNKQSDLVQLKDIAREYLGLLVSSAKSERVFSKSGKVSYY